MSSADDDVQAEGSTTPGAEPYPVDWEADVVLRDGSTAHVRPIRADDRETLQRFHRRQSERSTYMRFFTAMEQLSPRDLTRFTVLDHRDRVALVAVTVAPDGSEEIIGVARFDRIEADEAEVAFNVSDSHQGRGLASVLLEHVAVAAREVGIARFTAEVLPQNGKMLAVFREAGYETTQHVDDGIVTVSIDLDPTERSRQVMADREHRAEARSMLGLFTPGSVLLLASARGTAHAREARLAAAALAGGLVRGQRLVVVGLPALAVRDALGTHGTSDTFERYETVDEVPGTVDLVVVTARAADVPAAVVSLSRLAPRGLVVLSQGFAETGDEGVRLQRELVRAAHAGGMRVVGPASYGLFARRPDATFDATLRADPLPSGTIGLFCQSAPTAVTVLATVERRGLGVSSFLSAGNRADVSGNDLMQFWHDDDSTTVVGLYLESIGNPRKFSRIARRLSLAKPVVVVTAGRSGHIVPPGHTVRATRAPRRTLEEMFRQAGVIRAENTHQLLDIVQLLAHQPLPRGRRVGVLASSEYLAAIVAEAAGAAGLVVTGTPGILHEDAPDDEARRVVDAVYDDACDVVVAVHVPVLGGGVARFGAEVARAAARTGRPTVASVLGHHGIVPALSATAPDGSTVHVPAYSTPEDAVLALGSVVRYASWRSGDHGEPLAPTGVDALAARRVIESADDGPLPTEDVRSLLASYGIELWESVHVEDVEEAVAAARRLGWPVALKSTAESLRHRADLGGVRLNIADEAELRADHEAMCAALAEHVPASRRPDGSADVQLEVQRMAPSGVACVVRSTEDLLYGPVISFGLSGDAVDLLDDVSYGVPPLTTTDVAQMVRSIRAAPRLFGYKGLPEADAAAVEDLVARVSQLADDHPEISSLELYPVVVAERGAAVLSARVTLGAANRNDGLRRALPQ
ncbi:bifunctional acetate--CoA ligase family protein/GNAT family N-acetyltransferase [Sanguibacter suaedae]|uniref:GNAT family N-acetyltransferase n=1 Tax=Sanguibacter suaedae TaxID=2795737 RepID=A0A934IC86_9MICO|nr:GNAT family N-acetyltransferase [Sanguibacter suaedae]MBI9114219.1 GNAT family N-acetyltransferase [Sanguibacter suaedae]